MYLNNLLLHTLADAIHLNQDETLSILCITLLSNNPIYFSRALPNKTINMHKHGPDFNNLNATVLPLPYQKGKKNCEGLPVTARLKCFKSFLGYICSVKVPERRLYSGGAWSLLPDKKQKDEWKCPQVAPEKV